MDETHSYKVSHRSRERFLMDKIEAHRALEAKEIGDSGISELRPPYEISRQNPLNHTILFTLRGRGRIDLPGSRKVLVAGSVCLLPAGMDHAYGTDSTWSLLWFHPISTRFWNSLMPPTMVITTSTWAQRLKITAEEFLNEASQTGRINHLSLLAGYAQQVATFLQRELGYHENPRDSEVRRQLDALWQVVASEPQKDWSVNVLAREAHLSRPRLHYWVDHLYGQGAMEMVRRLRIEHAANLLQRSDLKLAEIAERVGYSSAYALSNAFKQLLGVSPRNYNANRSHKERGSTRAV